jgi:hypothetical protein
MKYLFIFIIFLMLGCGSSSRVVAPSDESRALDSLIVENNFIIESDWASPQVTASMAAIANSGLLGVGNNANNINLIGNPNFLKVEGDTISAYLPYFGERQMGGGYGTSSAIEFKGIPGNLNIEKDNKKQLYRIRFNIQGDNTETYNVMVDLYPNKTSFININSLQRFPIRYQGNVAAIEKEE